MGGTGLMKKKIGSRREGTVKTVKFDTIKSRMTELGFKWQPRIDDNFHLGLFYKRIKTERPITEKEKDQNEKDQLVVDLFDRAGLPGGHSVAESDRYHLEMSIIAEFPAKVVSAWTNLKIYNLSPSDFFENYNALEQTLVRAWEALALKAWINLSYK
jgi:hypothetical protein